MSSNDNMSHRSQDLKAKLKDAGKKISEKVDQAKDNVEDRVEKMRGDRAKNSKRRQG